MTSAECFRVDCIRSLCVDAHADARTNGHYSRPREPQELIALIHSELSECLEACREHEMPPDKHLPQHPSAAVELADAMIRIADMAGYMGWDLGQAIVDKMAFNLTRPRMHGKRF